MAETQKSKGASGSWSKGSDGSWGESLSIKDVPFFRRPIGSSNADIPISEDELGNITYKNLSTGFTYTVSPAADRRSLRGKASDLSVQTKKWFMKPRGEKREDYKAIVKALPGLPGIMAEDLQGMMSGEGTYGDVVEYAAGVGAASAPFKVPEGALRTFGGMGGAVRAGSLSTSKADRLSGLLENGVDSRTLWDEEQWFVGGDGQLRYEIDDSAMTFKKSFYDNDDERVMRRDTKGEGDWLTRGELSESLPHLNYETLEDLIKHPELFKAYPSLKDVKVFFRHPEYLDTNGAAYYGGMADEGFQPNSIYLDGNADDLKEDLVHEVQHAVQERENFARGGNMDMFAGDEAAKELEHQYDEAFKNFLYTHSEDTARLRKHKAEKDSAFEAWWSYKFNKYEALYGEEESRAVASRLLLTAQEKLETFPLDSNTLSRSRLGNTNPSKILREPYKDFKLAEGGVVNKPVDENQLADVEFEAGLRDAGTQDPLSKLGFDAKAGIVTGPEYDVAMYLQDFKDLSPEHKAGFKKARGEYSKELGREINAGDVVVSPKYTDNASVWNHEYRHKGVMELLNTVNADEVQARWGHKGSAIWDSLFRASAEAEAFVEVFDAKDPAMKEHEDYLSRLPKEWQDLSKEMLTKLAEEALERRRVAKLAEGGAVERSPRPRQRAPETNGEYTIHGRPVWRMNGQDYSEIPIIVPYGADYVVAPTVNGEGYEVPEDSIMKMLEDTGPYDFLTGDALQRFDSREEAATYIQERSDNMFNPVWKYVNAEKNVKNEEETTGVEDRTLTRELLRLGNTTFKAGLKKLGVTQKSGEGN